MGHTVDFPISGGDILETTVRFIQEKIEGELYVEDFSDDAFINSAYDTLNAKLLADFRLLAPTPYHVLNTKKDEWLEDLPLKAEWESKQYQRDRAVAHYDTIPEQLDQIYHDIDGWKAKIKAVKDKYPKP